MPYAASACQYREGASNTDLERRRPVDGELSLRLLNTIPVRPRRPILLPDYADELVSSITAKRPLVLLDMASTLGPS